MIKIALFQKVMNTKYGTLMVGFFAICATLFSFWSAYKKYLNFEYGKFDLGNMAQIAWNTSRGNFFEVTDQFGGNMSRLGMSHFDPILVLVSPIFWISNNPMAIVFLQHLILWSAVIPIFLISIKRTNNFILSILLVILYSLQPSLGYLLLWTEFHGITVAAAIFFWLFWYLEKIDYRTKMKQHYIFIALLLILTLIGKEEIGAMTALYGIYVFFKNKKLGISIFLLSTVWFVISFFVLIPAYSDVRDQSINNFLTAINQQNPKPEDVAGDNFFYLRYSYLGSSYSEMLLNLLTKPQIYTEVLFTKDNILTMLNVFGPLGFIAIFVPFWLIALPDYMISVLSVTPLFSITNHRISFIFSVAFISFMLILFKFYSKGGLQKKFTYTVLGLSLISSVFFIYSTNNPLFTPFTSRLKLQIPSTYAKDDKKFEVGKVYRSDKPDNSIECLNIAKDYVLDKNPEKYTGPDYLGAFTALRRVNAIFPTAIGTSDIFVADFYEDKAYEPLDAVNTWTVNKNILENTLRDQNFTHVLSCGRMIVFERGVISDTNVLIPSEGIEFMPIEYKNMGLNFKLDQKPSAENEFVVKYTVNRLPEINLNDKVFYWRIYDRVSDKDWYFIDYTILGFNQDLSGVSRDTAISISRDMKFIKNYLGLSGDLEVFYGISNQINSGAMYLGTWEF